MSHHLKHYGKKYGWLGGLLSLCWVAAPAQAGQLSAWQFSSDRNQLEFSTNEGVQPRAQLLEDPTRLVIDLPGTTVGQVATGQAIGQTVRQIRVGQLNAQTTRIIVELAPGYAIDPQQVKFHGISPTHWTVQLPAPQTEAGAAAIAPIQTAPPVSRSPVSSPPPSPPPTLINSAPSAPAQTARLTASASPMPQAATLIEEVRLTADGLFVRTSGDRPDLTVERGRRDRDRITVTVANASLSPQLTQPIAINQYGVSTLELSQQASQRSSNVQITLHVAKESPDWQAFASGSSGIVMLPQGGISAVARLALPAARPTLTPNTSAIAPASRAAIASQLPASQSPASQLPASQLPASQSPALRSQSLPTAQSQELQRSSTAATIAGVELNPTSNQLLIHSDRPVSYSGRWQSGLYQITLSPAQLADRVTGSDIGGAASPVLRVQLRQQTENTVVISVQPAAGVKFGTLNLVSPQLLALQVSRIASGVTPSAGSTGSAAVVLPSRIPSVTMPRLQSGRLVVVLDPGHGGSDPGAVGINGIQEKQVTLAIAQQLAAYLTQQGVQVILTRTDDRDVELEPRVQMAEQAHANLFVSIHANSISMDRPDVNGIETYYYSSGEQMAQVIQDSIVQGTGMNDKGTHSARFYVLRRTSMPAILIETGFVTGSDDAPHLANAIFQNQMALSIAQGILRFAQQNATALNR